MSRDIKYCLQERCIVLKPVIIVILVFFASLAPAAGDVAPAPPQVEASGFLLMDMDSNALLAAEVIDQRLEPASLTLNT